MTASGPLVGRHRYSFTRAPLRLRRVIRKDSEVRNRGGGTVSPPHPSGCSAISDRGARQQSDDSRNRIPLFLPAVKLRVDRVSPRCSLPAFGHPTLSSDDTVSGATESFFRYLDSIPGLPVTADLPKRPGRMRIAWNCQAQPRSSWSRNSLGIGSNGFNEEGNFVLYQLTNKAPPSLPTTLAIGSNGGVQIADLGLRWKARCAGLLRFGFRLRIVLIIAAHVLAFAAIYPLAFLVRFDLNVPPGVWRSAIACLPLVVVIKMAAFMQGLRITMGDLG